MSLSFCPFHGGRTLPDPDERIVELWINGLQVFEDQLLVQHAFVEGQGEACVDELAVEKRLEERTSSKVGVCANGSRGPFVDTSEGDLVTIAMKRPMKQK